MPLSLRQLEVFRLTMQTRNLTETARLLRVSQPAVSQTLKELEAQLGLPLFVRSGSRINPSGEARQLLPDVERLLTQSGAVESRAAELRDAGAGGLSLASISNVAGAILPQIVASFAQERPRVKLQVNAYVGRDDVMRQVRQEGADLGIIHAPVDDAALGVEPLMAGRMVCVLPPGLRIAGRGAITPADLMAQPVILSSASATPGLLLQAWLQEHGVRLGCSIETNFSYAGIGLAREGMGIFVTDPVILMTGLAAGLSVRPLEPPIRTTLTAIYSRQRPVPRMAVRFIVHLRAGLKQLSQQAPATCELQVI